MTVDATLCRSCVYRMALDSNGKTGSYGCQYLLVTGEKRPCKPGKDCTAYKRRGGRK